MLLVLSILLHKLLIGDLLHILIHEVVGMIEVEVLEAQVAQLREIELANVDDAIAQEVCLQVEVSHEDVAFQGRETFQTLNSVNYFFANSLVQMLLLLEGGRLLPLNSLEVVDFFLRALHNLLVVVAIDVRDCESATVFGRDAVHAHVKQRDWQVGSLCLSHLGLLQGSRLVACWIAQLVLEDVDVDVVELSSSLDLDISAPLLICGHSVEVGVDLLWSHATYIEHKERLE